MGQLIRTRSVLALVEGDAPVLDNPVLQPDGTTVHTLVACQQYRYPDEDIADNPARARHVFVDVADFEELGAPDQITVTIEPGDHLNVDTDDDGPEHHGGATLTAIQRSDGKWDWRLTHDNTNQLAGSDQGYDNRSTALEYGRRVVFGTYTVDIEFVAR